MDYRRYLRYLDNNFSDSEQLRFASLRQLLLMQVLVIGLSGMFELLAWQGELSSKASWSYFFLRGLLVYWLIGVVLQANYATTTPLRFDIDIDSTPHSLPDPLPQPPAELPSALVAATPVTTVPSPAALASELLAWRDQLLALTREKQPWLEPELTLTELAKRLLTTLGLLSKVINTGCGRRSACSLIPALRTIRWWASRWKVAATLAPRSTGYYEKVVGQSPSELTRPKP